MNSQDLERLAGLKKNYKYKTHKKYASWEGPFFLRIIREQEKTIQKWENKAYRLAAKLDRMIK